MGLREIKAARTRAAISAAALRLFQERGYEATTMEEIARAAEVAPTTLYRYFPTKDATLAGHLVPHYGPLSEDLHDRPADEALDVALGQALLSRLGFVDQHAEDLLRLRRMIDEIPAVRARVWDTWYEQIAALEVEIAGRAGVSPTELWVRLTARSCLGVLQLAVDELRTEPGRSAVEHAEEIIATLSSGALVLPRLAP